MDPQAAQALLDLNRRFYTQFGPAFAATRRRIQDGVRRVLAGLPDAPGERWLDLGCGSGALAVEWLRRNRQSAYHGLDFSSELLTEARRAVADVLVDANQLSEKVVFSAADLGAPGWAVGLQPGYRGVLAFAVLHHLPGVENREHLLRQVYDLLAPGGWFVHSEWQFQHSPRLMERVLPWETAGLTPDQLEAGDTLLDWRAALPEQPEQVGLRYVHLFSREELAGLARASGFGIREEFESDGLGGRLGLYQVWEKGSPEINRAGD